MASEASNRVLGAFYKNDHEVVAAELSEFQDQLYGHVRVMIPSASEDDEWVRTRKGVAVRVEDLPALAAAVDELAEVAASERVVARLPAGREELWVGVHQFKGESYVYIRRYYCSSGEWRPTAKGVNVRTELLDELRDLIRTLVIAAANSPSTTTDASH